MVLEGATGAGKTACLARMLRRLVREAEVAGTAAALERSLVYATALDIDTGEVLAVRARTAEILVLDDLHRIPKPHDFTFDVLDDRLRRSELTTVLATSVDFRKLCEALGVAPVPHRC